MCISHPTAKMLWKMLIMVSWYLEIHYTGLSHKLDIANYLPDFYFIYDLAHLRKNVLAKNENRMDILC